MKSVEVTKERSIIIDCEDDFIINKIAMWKIFTELKELLNEKVDPNKIDIEFRMRNNYNVYSSKQYKLKFIRPHILNADYIVEENFNSKDIRTPFQIIAVGDNNLKRYPNVKEFISRKLLDTIGAVYNRVIIDDEIDQKYDKSPVMPAFSKQETGDICVKYDLTRIKSVIRDGKENKEQVVILDRSSLSPVLYNLQSAIHNNKDKKFDQFYIEFAIGLSNRDQKNLNSPVKYFHKFNVKISESTYEELKDKNIGEELDFSKIKIVLSHPVDETFVEIFDTISNIIVKKAYYELMDERFDRKRTIKILFGEDINLQFELKPEYVKTIDQDDFKDLVVMIYLIAQSSTHLSQDILIKLNNDIEARISPLSLKYLEEVNNFNKIDYSKIIFYLNKERGLKEIHKSTREYFSKKTDKYVENSPFENNYSFEMTKSDDLLQPKKLNDYMKFDKDDESKLRIRSTSDRINEMLAKKIMFDGRFTEGSILTIDNYEPRVAALKILADKLTKRHVKVMDELQSSPSTQPVIMINNSFSDINKEETELDPKFIKELQRVAIYNFSQSIDKFFEEIEPVVKGKIARDSLIKLSKDSTYNYINLDQAHDKLKEYYKEKVESYQQDLKKYVEKLVRQNELREASKVIQENEERKNNISQETSAYKIALNYAEEYLTNPKDIRIINSKNTEFKSSIKSSEVISDLKSSVLHQMYGFIRSNNDSRSNCFVMLVNKKLPLLLNKESFKYLKNLSSYDDIDLSKIKMISLIDIDKNGKVEDINLKLDKNLLSSIVNFSSLKMSPITPKHPLSDDKGRRYSEQSPLAYKSSHHSGLFSSIHIFDGMNSILNPHSSEIRSEASPEKSPLEAPIKEDIKYPNVGLGGFFANPKRRGSESSVNTCHIIKSKSTQATNEKINSNDSPIVGKYTQRVCNERSPSIEPKSPNFGDRSPIKEACNYVGR